MNRLRLLRSYPFLLGFFLFFLLYGSVSQLASGQTVRPSMTSSSHVRLHVTNEELTVILTFPAAKEAVDARVRIKLVSPNDEIRATVTSDVKLVPGQKELAIRLAEPFAQVPATERNELHWLRLQYELSNRDGQALASGAEGLDTPETSPFVLAAAASRAATAGRWYEVRVHAKTDAGKPLRKLRLEGTLLWESTDGSQELKASAATNSAGNGALEFLVPKQLHAGSGTVKVTASHGLVTRSVEKDVSFFPAGYLLMDTDKEIYQPGQTLHARILHFDSERRALPKEVLDVRITDEERTLLSRQSVVTNAFGVADIDWSIPGNVLQGNYRIQATPVRADVESDDPREGVDRFVHIYRYDLPNFTVSAKADRPYYLPSQNAQVMVSADYLFGRPVTRGKVRVVEEEHREWDFRKQVWNITEGQVQSGELDHDGHFTAQFNLRGIHDDLEDSTYRRFRDLDLAAYVTDLTTGRTEQRRFSLRVTRDPIHVYIAEPPWTNRSRVGTYFVSTFYADGTPARCKVKLSLVKEDDEKAPKHPLRVVTTNKYGLAKLEDLNILAYGREDIDALLAEASDDKARTGQSVRRIETDENPYLLLNASHAIHKPGEPIEISLRSNQLNKRIVVEVSREEATLTRQEVLLRNGKASVVFPYDERFTDEVSVAAYSLGEEDHDLAALVTVLYPKNRRLGVSVQPDKSEHRPGESANVKFAVHTPDSSAAESVLGVKIVDRAVEERQRTDSEFGQRSGRSWWRWSLWSEDNGGFGSITRDDLDLIALNQPVPQDLDLVAEYILHDRYVAMPELLNDHPDRSAAQSFSNKIELQFASLERNLKEWNGQGRIPSNSAELAVLAKERGIDLADLRDPWGTPYRFELGFAGGSQFLKVISSGPDKQFGTSDDFTARETRRDYFLYYGKLLEKASLDLRRSQGRFIRDRKTLRAELLKQGVDFDNLRDPWNQPYEVRFSIAGPRYVTEFVSHGEETQTKVAGKRGDGTIVWRHGVDYFLTTREHIARIFEEHSRAGGADPTQESELKAMLHESGIDLDDLRDAWGNSYWLALKKVAQYGNRVTIQHKGASGERTSEPVTLVRRELHIMSSGPDGHAGTDDDFAVASYSVLVSEQSAKDDTPKPAPSVVLIAGTGAIRGTVADPTGAVIVGAIVKVTREDTREEYSLRTDDSGNFEIRDLTPGIYQVEIQSHGFTSTRLTAVSVEAMDVTELNVQLQIGAATETVEVSAGAPIVQMTVASLSTVERSFSNLVRIAPGVAKPEAMSTPRLRQDFPETMLWEPAVITDRHGRATLNFKLADNITTWKLTAVASTKNGELGRAEKDLRAFQPFFLEHDPPRILTQGDEIDYPVVLRNYLDRPQTLKAWIRPESWFNLLGPAEVPVKVDAGDAAHAIFRYRAVAAVTDGKQQVSAANAAISDAAQKPVDVHPFGRLAAVTATTVLAKKATLSLHAPEDAITGSLRGRIKIYPNLLAHVLENLEAGLERPHGCGEQTISSTYPSLLVNEIYETSVNKPAIALKARRYLQAGYERLLSYQDSSGGFTYWGHGDPNLALTAYALEFLHSAGRFIGVDAGVISNAEEWIVKQQRADGAWNGGRNDKDAVLVTAYIAQTLAAMSEQKDEEAKPGSRKVALGKALSFLEAHRDLIDEPYVIASYALAAKAAGNQARAAALLDALRRSVHREGTGAYWALERNTPFYAWGHTGRVESTALSVRALATASNGNLADKDLAHQGLLFLVGQQEKDGMWYSGQTTMLVLKTMLSMIPQDNQGTGGQARLRVRVNGHEGSVLDLPPTRTVAAPLEVDAGDFIKPGENRLELETLGEGIGAGGREEEGILSAQFTAEAYVPWKEREVDTSKAVPNASSKLKFSVSYSATQGSTATKVECRVRVERLGYQGYGMMLGEIGLPPGVDVDRESLERALQGNYSVYRYDVLPDRVILYLWPTAGGSEFTFKFRPRFAMQAETAPSLLYDYYNPEAAVTLRPVRFEVTPEPELGKSTTEARRHGENQ
jgi:hypothetical protein